MENSSPRRARLKRILPFGYCLLGLLAVHLIVFRDHWLGRTWFPFDFPAGYYGIVAYWVTSLQSGEWPQWVPYQSMGYPLLMNPQAGFFYPPFWLFVVLRIPFTLHAAVIVQILHVLLGAAGVLLLANELFGSLLAAECAAISFLFFGGFYTNAEHADIIRGFAWVPWLLWSSLFGAGRWKLRNLLVPLFVACFITGAYTGQVIAGLTLLLVYVLTQALIFSPRPAALTLLWKQAVLIGLGVLLASAYLLTGAALASGLTRSRDVPALHLTWLTGRNLFDLIFPSNLIHPVEDYSMYGMQIPVILLLFLPFIEIRFLKRLAPILVVAGTASLLCFQAFAPLSNILRHVLPVFALSRFPAADYREYVYLAVLLAATAGIASLLGGRTNIWKAEALGMPIAALFGLCVLSCLQHDIAAPLVKPFLTIAKGDLIVLLGGALLVAACCWWGKPAIAAVVLFPLLVMVSLPVIDNEKQFWVDSDLLKNVYDGKGFPLQLNGRLRTAFIFNRHETARGPRVFGDNHQVLSWWGYLDGAYLTNDSGGVIPLARTTVESNPALMQFMLAGSRLLGIPCDSDPRPCGASRAQVDLSNRAEAGTALEYRRNGLEYEVSLPVRSLVVENEIAIRGWHVTVDGKAEPVETVDGCLRGWIVPAGKHRVALNYLTPMLVPGVLLSAAALVCWGAVVWVVYRTDAWPRIRKRYGRPKTREKMEPPSELESETSSLPMRCSTN